MRCPLYALSTARRAGLLLPNDTVPAIAPGFTCNWPSPLPTPVRPGHSRGVDFSVRPDPSYHAVVLLLAQRISRAIV